MPVGMAAVHQVQPTHAPRRHAPLAKALHMTRMAVMEAAWHQARQRLAQHLCSRPAEDFF